MEAAPELRALEEQLGIAERDANALVEGLTEELGTWRATTVSWSVAHCLDHLATANRVYLEAMQPVARRAREQGKVRRRPALPGLAGRLFVRALEPPVRRIARMKSPRSIRPRAAPTLSDALACFIASQNEVRSFLHAYASLDLARIHFPNPFVPGIRFSLATGLHVITAHERRHLAQAWRVRQTAENSHLAKSWV